MTHSTAKFLLFLLYSVRYSFAALTELSIVQASNSTKGNVFCEVEVFTESGKRAAIFDSTLVPSTGTSSLVVDDEIGYDAFGERTADGVSGCGYVKAEHHINVWWSGWVNVDDSDPVHKIVIYSTVDGLEGGWVTFGSKDVAVLANNGPVLTVLLNPPNLIPTVETVTIGFSTDRLIEVCDLRIFARDGSELSILPSNDQEIALKIQATRVYTRGCLKFQGGDAIVGEDNYFQLKGHTAFDEDNPPVRVTGVANGEGLKMVETSISTQFLHVNYEVYFAEVSGAFDVQLDAVEYCVPDSDPNNCPVDKYGPDCASDVYCDTSNGICRDCSCYGKDGNGACTSCIEGWFGIDCRKQVQQCDKVYADCDGPCELQSTKCTCMGGVLGTQCLDFLHGDIEVLMPVDFSLEVDSQTNEYILSDFLMYACPKPHGESMFYEDPTRETISCDRSYPGYYVPYSVCSAAQPDPVRAGEALLAILSCVPKIAIETGDASAGYFAGSGNSTSALIANALEKRELSNLKGGELLNQARLLAETFAFAGYPIGERERTFLAMDLEPLDRRWFTTSRLPTKQACLGVCPCGTRLVLVGVEPICQSVSKSAMLEISMNYLRCATFPTEILLKHSLATRSMFLSASFHCLNELIVEDNANRDASDTAVNPLLKSASKRLFSRLDYFSSSNPVLANNIGRVGKLLNRDFLVSQDELGKQIFRVPPLTKNAYEEQLEQFTDELFKMEQRFAQQSLKQFAKSQFEGLETQIENLREYTGEQLNQLRSEMKHGFQVTMGEFKAGAQSILDVIKIEQDAIFQRIESLQSRGEVASNAIEASAHDTQSSLLIIVQKSQEIVEVVHTAVLAAKFKPVAKQREVVNKARFTKTERFMEFMQNALKCVNVYNPSDILFYYRYHWCLAYVLKPLQTKYKEAKNSYNSEIGKLNQLKIEYQKHVKEANADLEFEEFDAELNRIYNSLDRLSCLRTKLLQRIASKAAEISLSDSDDGNIDGLQDSVPLSSMAQVICDGTDVDESDDPVLSVVEWDIAHAEMTALAHFSGLCKPPPPPEQRRLQSVKDRLNQRLGLGMFRHKEEFHRSLLSKTPSDPFKSLVPDITTTDSVDALTEVRRKLRKEYFLKLDQLNNGCVDFLTAFRKLTATGKVLHQQLIEMEMDVIELEKFERVKKVYQDRIGQSESVNTALNQMIGGGEREPKPKLLTGPINSGPSNLEFVRLMMGNYLAQQESMALVEIATTRLSMLCGAVAFTDPGDRTGNYAKHCRTLPLYPATTTGIFKLRKKLVSANNELGKPFASSQTWVDVIPQGWETTNPLVALEITMAVNLRDARKSQFKSPLTFELLGPGVGINTPYFALNNVRMDGVGLFFTDDDGNVLGGRRDKVGSQDKVRMRIDLSGRATKNVGLQQYHYDVPEYLGLISGYSLPTEDGKCDKPGDKIYLGQLCKGQFKLSFKVGGASIALPSPYTTWTVQILNGHEDIANATRVFFFGSITGESNPDLEPFVHPAVVQSWESELVLRHKVDSSFYMLIGGVCGGLAVLTALVVVMRHRNHRVKDISNGSIFVGRHQQESDKHEFAVQDSMEFLKIHTERKAATKILNAIRQTKGPEVTSAPGTELLLEMENPRFEL